VKEVYRAIRESVFRRYNRNRTANKSLASIKSVMMAN